MRVPAIDALPRFRLFADPSPFHRLERLGDALGGRAELWIKREDLLPLAFGGNKLRNLEFLVGAALADGADTLVTSGRRWSNHCRLTAAAGARAGLDVHLVLSGPPATGPDGAAIVNPGRRLDELLGATVHQLPTADRAARGREVVRIAENLRGLGRRPHVIAVGGSGLPGAAGQVLAAGELLDQARATGARPDVVILPTATGGTQAGLIAGLAAAGSDAAVVGVLVARADAELRPVIAAILHDLGELTGRPVPAPATTTAPAATIHDLGRLTGRSVPTTAPAPATAPAIELDSSQLGRGYGIPTTAATEAAKLLARTEGILVDPIYTAKALAALITGVRSGRWDGRQIVFWHAGGTTGLFEPLEDPPPE